MFGELICAGTATASPVMFVWSQAKVELPSHKDAFRSVQEYDSGPETP